MGKIVMVLELYGCWLTVLLDNLISLDGHLVGIVLWLVVVDVVVSLPIFNREIPSSKMRVRAKILGISVGCFSELSANAKRDRALNLVASRCCQATPICLPDDIFTLPYFATAVGLLDIQHSGQYTVMAPSRADRLAQIRALRAAGKTGFDAYQVEDAEDVYETVDEEGYKKVVRSRLDQDDFVVDDNGAGYADDGREDWQEEREAYDDSESDGGLPKHGKAGERHAIPMCRYRTDTPASQAETRRGCGTPGQAEQGHQQVLQQERYNSHQ
jgi:hypothetical protein